MRVSAADQLDLVHLAFVEARIRHDLLHMAERVLEEIFVDLLVAWAGPYPREIHTVEQSFDLHAALMR